MQKRGAMSAQGIHMSDINYDSRYSIMMRLSQTKFAMSFKLKLVSLVSTYPSPKLIGSCKCGESDIYVKFKPLRSLCRL